MALFNDCSLLEIECKGCAFTWVNNREERHFIKEKLDRILCNLERRLLYPAAEASALPAVGSNHNPLLLTYTSDPMKRKKSPV